MAGADWLIVAGAALVLLLLLDIFFTVLHPQAHGGPWNRYQNRMIWNVVVRLGRLFPPGRWRDRLLSMGGPGLSIAALLSWLVMLVSGFGLIWLARIHSFTGDAVPPDPGLREALLYSGLLSSTLGLGSITIDLGWLRLLATLEGMMGFMLLTIAVTYILAVYRAQGDASSFALDVSATFGDDARDGARRIAADLDRADGWAESAATRLARVVSAHSQYPILHYFRPPEPRGSLVRQAGALLVLFEHLEASGSGWRTRPGLVALRNTLHTYLEEVTGEFIHDSAVDVDQDSEREWSQRHRQALRHMGYEVDSV